MAVSLPKTFPISGVSQGWSASAVPTGVPTTVFTMTVPPGNGYALFQAAFSGRADGTATIKVNGTPVGYMQINWTYRSDQLLFLSGHIMNPGDVLTIQIYNYGQNSADYFGNIQGQAL